MGGIGDGAKGIEVWVKKRKKVKLKWRGKKDYNGRGG